MARGAVFVIALHRAAFARQNAGGKADARRLIGTGKAMAGGQRHCAAAKAGPAAFAVCHALHRTRGIFRFFRQAAQLLRAGFRRIDKIKLGHRPACQQFRRGETGIFIFRRGLGHGHSAAREFRQRGIAHICGMNGGRALAEENPQAQFLAFGTPHILQLAEANLDFFGGGTDGHRISGIRTGLESEVDCCRAAFLGGLGVKHGIIRTAWLYRQP